MASVILTDCPSVIIIIVPGVEETLLTVTIEASTLLPFVGQQGLELQEPMLIRLQEPCRQLSLLSLIFASHFGLIIQENL